MGFLTPYASQTNKTFGFDDSNIINTLYGLPDTNKAASGVNKKPTPATKENLNLPQPASKPVKDSTAGISSGSLIKNASLPDTNHLKKDTLHTIKDSLAALKDTVKVDSMAIDSTARLKNFRYKRQDEPYVRLNLQTAPDFFAEPSPQLSQKVISIDSTGKYVEVKRIVAGHQTKILLRLPIDEYLKLQLALNRQEMWRQLSNGSYQYTGSKKELGQLIKNFTNFEIPLPSVGVLSIFGKPKISLHIGGAVDIHGAWRNQTTEGVTASMLGNTTNEPDFQQQVQINVNGTIGDKLHIDADWNTQRTFEYQNQLHIKYTGYPDEIVQSIEAGNVSLQTSPLVGGSDALFGVKAEFQLGPLTLTTLASQKKGETKEVSVNSGATSQTFNVRAYQYATNNYFVDTVYASTNPKYNFFYNYYGKSVPEVNPAYKIVDIQVWKSVNTLTIDQSKERQVNAFIDLPPRQGFDKLYDSLYSNPNFTPTPGKSETGRFVLLTPDVDYTVHPNTGYITFHTQIQDQDAIAVAYRIEGATSSPNDDIYYGEFLNAAGGDTLNGRRLVLKLIKPEYLKPQYSEAWRLLLKNIYPLGGTNIKQDGFELYIKYEIPGQDPVSQLTTNTGVVQLLNAFGLDRYDASGNPTPDNVFDWNPGVDILPVDGEIIFPSLEPFGKNLPSGIPDSLGYQSVYDTTQDFAQQDKLHDRWEITGKYSGEASSTYQLGFNVVENSVRVTLNGRELTPGVDYTVDYNIGQLTILNREALVPGADLKITFEQNDLFQLASKTLLGARGIFNISDNTKLGFSILNLNQQTLSDKVQIGEEPISNTIMGVDFNTKGDLPFLTDALDHVISTKQMSSFSLAGEAAYMNPNPNTKVSNIPDDKGQSIAYIDDFEGAKKLLPIGVSYTAWKDLSAPTALSPINSALAGLTPKELMNFKAKAFWYSITPSDVHVQDIWGTKKQVATQDQNVPVLDYVFIPDTPGTYNWDPNMKNPSKTWGGMMRVLSSASNDLQAQNIQYIEFWLHVVNAPKNAKMYIDLGRISEAVIPDNILHTEDVNHNGVLNPAYDLGLDGLSDKQERDTTEKLGYYQYYSNAQKQDPSGDDFSFNSSTAQSDINNIYNYYHINGTQGNGVLTDIGRIPDTEDLNLNGNLDLVNSYFRYAVPLDTNEAIKEGLISGGGNLNTQGVNEGWYLYRIPLQDTSQSVGSPSLSDVEYIRVFTTGVDTLIHVRFADFNLVGNQWQQAIPYDTVMSVSVINYEDNPNYKSPPGVTRARDNSQPNQVVYQNEQSMDLIVKGLQAGQSRDAIKYLYRPLDVFNYKEMKLFIHGDETPESNISDSTCQIYYRFGTDTSNYYEYRQPVRPGWNDVDIIFSKLTALKQKQDSTNMNTLITTSAGGPGQIYGVKGSPTLTAVKFLDIGIRNVTNNSALQKSVKGEIWIDALRVIGADNHPGYAYSVSSSLKLADLMNVNFNMSYTDPYFHSLSQQFGSRVDTKNWSMSASLDLLKLLPFNLPGSSLSLNYSHTESVSKPLYEPGTDVNINEAASLLNRASKTDTSRNSRFNPNAGQELIIGSQTINTSDSWSASNIALRIPSNNWFIKNTINAITLGFNYNKTFSRSPTVLSSKSWVWNANFNYNVNFGQDDYFYPANIPIIGTIFSFLADYRNLKIYYAPQNVSLTLSARRNRSITTNRAIGNIPSQNLAPSHDFATQRGFNTTWKLTDGGLLNLTANYNLSINSSLAYLEANANNVLLPESEVWRQILSGSFFGQDYQYQQNLDIRTSPKLPSLWNIDKYFNISAGYSVSYQWTHSFNQKVNGLDAGRSAGYSSRSTLGLRLALKALSAPLFSNLNRRPENELGMNRNFSGERNLGREGVNRRVPGENVPPNPVKGTNNTGIKDSLLVKEKSKGSPIINSLLFLESVSRFLFFDYETISANFSNDNSVSKSALAADGSGFYNFFGLTDIANNGPSRLFMLGLSSSVGKRTPGLSSLNDVFSQKNSLDFQTSKPLWQGARIDLNWQVGWSLNKSTTLSTTGPDSLTGIPSLQNINATGTISRSFLTLPPVLIFSVFKSGINRVHQLYNPNAADPTANLSNAFTEGFETLPWLSRLGFLKDFANLIPRPNWTITWDGLEKYYPFKTFAERVSLTHAYTSTYTEGWYLDPDGKQVVQTQRIQYGFSPLIGLNMTFKRLWDGNLSGSIKYSVNDGYDLGVSTQNITESYSRDIGVSASYSKSGFELPLFGISLKNDIEFTFSYTNSQSSTIVYNMNQYKEGGTPQDGTVRVTIEPRIRYTLSSKVTLSIFYTKTTIQPVGASVIPPSTSNEAGLDVHIAIQ